MLVTHALQFPVLARDFRIKCMSCSPLLKPAVLCEDCTCALTCCSDAGHGQCDVLHHGDHTAPGGPLSRQGVARRLGTGGYRILVPGQGGGRGPAERGKVRWATWSGEEAARYTDTRAGRRVDARKYTYTRAHSPARTHAYIHRHASRQTGTHARTHIHTHRQARRHVHTHTHTYTHTVTHSFIYNATYLQPKTEQLTPEGICCNYLDYSRSSFFQPQ